MIALSALNKVHKTGLFGNCQDKNKDELTTVSEVENQIDSSLKSSEQKIGEIKKETVQKVEEKKDQKLTKKKEKSDKEKK